MESVRGLNFWRIQSNIALEPNTAVKRLMIIPIIRVIAKPLIGPVPNMKRTHAVIRVVMWESKIATHAFW